MATLRTLYAYMWAHPGKQLLFMGQEFAQGAEWSEARSLDWWLLDSPDHRGVARLIADLNRTYRESDALWSQDTSPEGFRWIDANDASGNVYSFVRYGVNGGTPASEGVAGGGGESTIACVANFSSVPHENYRLGLPFAGRWDEVINTDADQYFGSGVGNFGGVTAVDEPWHGLPASTTLRVPPLGALWLRYTGPR
jgi:1,4-alpha-glucan branching enzyme